MSTNGQNHDASVLHWQGRLLTTEDLRDCLNGERELVVSPRAIITPLAADELRARGVRVIRESSPRPLTPTPSPTALPQGERGNALWGYAQERPELLVRGVVQALQRDGVTLRELPSSTSTAPCQWTRALAECVAQGECLGGIVFCQDPGLVACVSNKVDGVRAVTVASVAQAARAVLTLSANLVAIETVGRTFFELRQIVKTLCVPSPRCPEQVACTLKELEHAHR